MKTPERHQTNLSYPLTCTSRLYVRGGGGGGEERGVKNVSFSVVLVSLLLILNIFNTFF